MSRPPVPNKFAGPCIRCGHTVAAGKGYRTRTTDGQWASAHHRVRVISPTGPWDKFEPYAVDGCPGEADRENAARKARSEPPYPRHRADGTLYWACCESTIGPPCQHRQVPS